MRRKRSLTTTRAGSPNRYCNFSVKGHRFRNGLGTDDEETAEILAGQIRNAALLGLRQKPEITLTASLARYWIERGQHAATSDDIERYGHALIAGLGAETRLSAISNGPISAYVATRRVRQVKNRKTGRLEWRERANASVNREIEHLRTVMLAAKRWGCEVAEPDWPHLRLDEPENVQTILTAEREAAFYKALRSDFHALVAFALLSGVRLGNAIGLTWGQVDWDARTITFRVKSRKPGRRLLVLPLTAGLAAILSTERAHNPGAPATASVFTYVCVQNRHDPKRSRLQVKGKRYPFTQTGWRREWDRARQEIGLPELRFHDLRHTAATRALRASKDLKAVQRMLGHADISSTLRYTASDIDDVRAAIEAVETQNRHKVVPANGISEETKEA